MSTVLNITNGDSAVDLMGDAGIPGDYLPWRDVLHEGPVPAGLDLDPLSRVRAEFIVSRGWGNKTDVEASFVERNRALRAYRNYDKIMLWFEHDLYDQLQILEVLNWFSNQVPAPAMLTLICTDRYLGRCNSDQLANLEQFEQIVSAAQLTLASRAWAAFCQSTPLTWYAMLSEDTGVLPFLHHAILRMLQEYPALDSGLSRTERTILELVSEKPSHPGRLFGDQQHTEERIFMGDLSFWHVLDGLLEGDSPLLELPGGKRNYDPRNREDVLSINQTGESVLRGNINWIDIRCPDKWLGGVHIRRDNLWTWDDQSRVISRWDK